MCGFNISHQWMCPSCNQKTTAILNFVSEKFDITGQDTLSCQWCECKIVIHWSLFINIVCTRFDEIHPVTVSTDITRIEFKEDEFEGFEVYGPTDDTN